MVCHPFKSLVSVAYTARRYLVAAVFSSCSKSVGKSTRQFNSFSRPARKKRSSKEPVRPGQNAGREHSDRVSLESFLRNGFAGLSLDCLDSLTLAKRVPTCSYCLFVDSSSFVKTDASRIEIQRLRAQPQKPLPVQRCHSRFCPPPVASFGQPLPHT
uniref:Uncharacterized protein n=1 Tax=Peronospora matthiolae TaxID=2874970 RepID=A0AAV1TY56_9STRA